VNGVFFRKHQVDDVLEAVAKVEQHAWNVDDIITHARKFDEDNFKDQLKKYVEQAYVNFLKGG
jgi:hypothetical protein